MQGNVFTTEKLKIVPTIKNLFVSHPMPEHADELSSLVRIKLQQPSLTAINNHAGCMWVPGFFPLVFESAAFSPLLTSNYEFSISMASFLEISKTTIYFRSS